MNETLYTLDVRLAEAEAQRLRGDALAACLVDLARAVRGAVLPLAQWYRRQQLHEDLVRLNDHALADLGIDRTQIRDFVRRAYPQAQNANGALDAAA